MKGIASQSDVLALETRGLPPDLPSSTYEMILRGAASNPSAPALSFFLSTADHREPERWTYSELVQEITRTANMFFRLGVRADSVVAYLLPNLPETHFVIWGGEAAGIVFAINPLLEKTAIADQLNAAGAKVLVTLAPFPGTDLWPKVQAVLPHVPSLQHVIRVDLANHVRGPKQLAARGPQLQEGWSLRVGETANDIPSHIEVHDFRRAVALESADVLNSGRQFNPLDLSSYFCTGGTTGSSKIAMRRHGNEVANAWSAGEFLGDSIGPGKTVFCGLPLFHVNAVMVTGLLPFSRGAHVLLGTAQGYRTEGLIQRFWEIADHHRVNFFSGVPTLYAALLDVPVAGHDVRSLEYGLCGAAPMPVEVFRAFQDRTGVRILEGYGLTEGVCVSSINPPLGERRLGSIGLRIPEQAIKAVVLDESGDYVRDCAPDEAGALVICGPNVFAGYLRPEHNEQCWIDLDDGKRWLNTGDLGRCDADGYFWLTGRKKDLIIRGGHNIDPARIEEPLYRHPAIELAAAVGRPEPRAGEIPVAYVELKPGASATEQQLLEHLRSQISERAAMPKHIRVLKRMPLTAIGKIFKPELRRRETIDALESALAEAGLMDASVTVDPTDSNRISLCVNVADQALTAPAREILSRYPFAFTIKVCS
jgi:fatty-acyl-CoA synthase